MHRIEWSETEAIAQTPDATVRGSTSASSLEQQWIEQMLTKLAPIASAHDYCAGEIRFPSGVDDATSRYDRYS